jgi:hypothetical protein
LKARTYEDLNNINKSIMEESERLVRYLEHLKYLDQGHVEYAEY